MPKFIVENTFQFNGLVRRAGSTLEIDKAMLAAEIEQGVHMSGRPMSGLLNHCIPGDDATAELCKGINMPVPVVEMTEEEKQEKIDAFRAEMDAIGAAYDRRWGLARMEREAQKARIEKGQQGE